MKIKVIYGSDIRRWHFSQKHQFEALVRFARDTFNFSASENYNLQFEDDEGDRVTLSCENDLRDALDIAKQEKRKSLKIYVVPTIMDNNPREILTTQVPELIESLESEPIALPVKELSWQECMNDFFSNEAVDALLPDFICQVMRRLRNNCLLKKALMEVLELKEFDVINSHELFTNFIKKHLDCISERAKLLLPTLLIFNDDHIISIIPQLAETATQMLSDASDVELDVTPIFEKLFPDWGAATMMNANNPDEGCEVDLDHIFETQNSNEAAEAMVSSSHNCEQKEEICHDNVACDLCNSSPIYGIRYKCAVCPDFDLCSKCEEVGGHNKNHALLKFHVPYTGFQRGNMRGIRDMFCNRHIRRGRCFNPYSLQFKNLKKQKSQKKQKNAQKELNENENENENPTRVEQVNFEEQSEFVLCLCGSTMIKSIAEYAYKPTKEITCGVCDLIIDKSSQIYHCPKLCLPSHLEGYDICTQCVADQMKIERPNNCEPEKIMQSQSQSQLQLPVEIEQHTEINHIDYFPYQKKLSSLLEMGFDEEDARLELMRTNGNVSRAIEALL